MAQLKEDLLLEKELAIQEERKHYEQKLIRERQLKDDEKKDDLVIVASLKLITVKNFSFILNYSLFCSIIYLHTSYKFIFNFAIL